MVFTVKTPVAAVPNGDPPANVTSGVPVSAVAQLVGIDPVKILITQFLKYFLL
jgi:hypothetical protein